MSSEGPRFITVDLEVWSKTDLAPLARALEPRSMVLYVGKVKKKFLASFEAHGSSPEETIWRLLKLVKPLRGSARKLWNQAEARVFNIGFESGNRVVSVIAGSRVRSVKTAAARSAPFTVHRVVVPA